MRVSVGGGAGCSAGFNGVPGRARTALESGTLWCMNGAVSQLDQMTQQNASLVEQSSAAAESLKEQAGRLAEVVGTFRLQRKTVGS